jgi:hypothetical protein
MDFFNSLPSRLDDEDEDEDEGEVERDEPAFLAPPSGVLGGPVAVSGVIHRSEHLFLGLRYATAYPTGVQFGIQISVRRGDRSRTQWEETKGQVFGHPVRRHTSESGELRIGVELADGSRASSEGRWPHRRAGQAPPSGPVLIDHGGNGSGGGRTARSSRELWLWPLPEGDTVDLVFEWPILQLAETRYTINALQLRAAARTAIPHWDE